MPKNRIWIIVGAFITFVALGCSIHFMSRDVDHWGKHTLEKYEAIDGTMTEGNVIEFLGPAADYSTGPLNLPWCRSMTPAERKREVDRSKLREGKVDKITTWTWDEGIIHVCFDDEGRAVRKVYEQTFRPETYYERIRRNLHDNFGI